MAVGADSDDFAVARYNPDGSLDPAFDGDGRVTTGFGADETATSVAIQPDGKILVAGFTEAGPSPANFALVRYNANGSLDGGFDDDGLLFTDFGAEDVATDVLIGAGGAIVAVGGTSTGAGAADFAFARYEADGSPDNSFDGDGLRTINFGALEVATDAELQPDGRIVAAGLSVSGMTSEIALTRLTPAGAPDASLLGRAGADPDRKRRGGGGRRRAARRADRRRRGGRLRRLRDGALPRRRHARSELREPRRGDPGPRDLAGPRDPAERQDPRPVRPLVRRRALQPRRLRRHRLRPGRLRGGRLRRQLVRHRAQPPARRQGRRRRLHRFRAEPRQLRARPPARRRRRRLPARARRAKDAR